MREPALDHRCLITPMLRADAGAGCVCVCVLSRLYQNIMGK